MVVVLLDGVWENVLASGLVEWNEACTDHMLQRASALRIVNPEHSRLWPPVHMRIADCTLSVCVW